MSSSYSPEISIELARRLDSLELTDLVRTTIRLICAIHPSVDQNLAKLCGIFAFMSAGIKFARRIPEWMAGITEQALMEVIDGIKDG